MKPFAHYGLVLAFGSVAALGQQPAPSAVLQPALDELRQAAGAVQLGRWKGSNAAKDEVDANLASIRKDLDGTLPGLLVKADAAPSTLSATLPVTRNVGALYDVLLRVVERANGAAPADQLAALDHARVDLDAARRTLDDRVQFLAITLEGRVTTLQQQVTIATAAPAVPPPATPTKTTKKKTKPKPKPTPPAQ